MRSRFQFLARTPILLLLLLPLLLGHGDGCECGGGDDGIDFGPPTETVCPPGGSTLTYENFGRDFMESYCLRCHSSSVTGADREGAPADHNFDSKLESLALKDHIDWMTGSGPAATNEKMPPNGPTPTLAERVDLSLWLVCDSI